MKKIWVVVFFILLFPAISAEIIIDDTFDSEYSYGDLIEANFSLEKQVDSSGYLEAVLDCNKGDLLVSKRYLQVEANEKEIFDLEFPANVEGECVFEVSFGSESESSEEFSVSDDISIDFSMSSRSVFPGESVSINGTARKANGQFLDGTIKIFSEELVDRIFEVDDGRFEASFEIPQDSPSGKITFFIEAIERNYDEEVINSGKVNFNVDVESEPTTIEVVAVESVEPPENLSMSFRLLDQGGKLIGNETILLKVFDPLKEIVSERTFSSDDNYVYFFDADSLRGAWDFNFYHGSVFSKKQIFVGENPQVSALVVYDSGISYLRVTNEGNVPYSGVVLVELENSDGVEEIGVNVDLGVGESVDEKLEFNGDYNLSFQGESLGAFTLSGASVGLDLDLSESSYWGFFIVVFVFVLGFVGYKGRGRIAGFIKKRRERKAKKKKSKSKEVKKEDLYTETFKTKSLGFSGDKAFIVFFRTDSFLDELTTIASRYGWNFRKVNERVHFILLYSKDQDVEKKIFSFVNDSRNFLKDKRVRFSISIHSDRLTRKPEFLKEFSTVGKRLLDYSKGEVLASKNFFDSVRGLNGSVRYFDLGDGILEAYSILF